MLLREDNQNPAIRSHRLEDVLREMNWKGRLAALDQEMAKLGMSGVVFKGGAAIYGLYEVVGIRPLSDVDLWISSPDLEPTANLLQQLGYARASGQPGNFTDAGWSIDLHASPLHQLDPGFVLDLKRYFTESQPLFPNACALRRLRPEHEFVVTLLHATKHAFNRTIWLVDLMLQMQRIALDELVGIVEESGATRCLEYACLLLERRFGYRVHLTARPRLNAIELAYVHGCSSGQAPAWLGMLIPVFSIHGFRKRCAYFRKALFPDGVTVQRLSRLLDLTRTALTYLTAGWGRRPS
jgi:hypothetical protein